MKTKTVWLYGRFVHSLMWDDENGCWVDGDGHTWWRKDGLWLSTDENQWATSEEEKW